MSLRYLIFIPHCPRDALWAASCPLSYLRYANLQPWRGMHRNSELLQQCARQRKLDMHDDRVVINVSGQIFETRESTLDRFPETLLGDPSRRRQYYNPHTREYFFDRHRAVFESILYFYQSGGRLVLQEDMPFEVFSEEVKFFQLGEHALYSVVKYVYKEKRNPPTTQHRSGLQQKIWNLMERPDSSTFARLVSMFSVLMIVLSVLVSCVETLPVLRDRQCQEVSPGNNLRQPPNSTVNFTSSGLPENTADCVFEVREVFVVIEYVCYSWFLLEYLVRFVCAPDRELFLKSWMNFVDLLAVCPFFVVVIVGNRRFMALSILRLTRLLRVFRIFKLTRYSRGLRILGATLMASLKELETMLLFMIIIVIVSSSALYYAELQCPESFFDSIPGAFWWSIITITTVGYGDVYPITYMGRVVGSVCAVLGVLAFSLPVMAFATNFKACLKCEPILKQQGRKKVKANFGRTERSA